MKIGLVGFPGSGKTTVFNAITGLSAETGMGASRGKTNLGVVKVPDPRIDKLRDIYKPIEETYAEVTFSDIAAGAGAQGLRPQVLNSMREVDASAGRARLQRSRAATPPNPLQEAIDLESRPSRGLELVEKRLERIKKEKANPRELPRSRSSSSTSTRASRCARCSCPKRTGTSSSACAS